VTRRRLQDPDEQIGAHLSQYDAEQVVARLGGRLPTDAEWREVARVAHWIAPQIERETPQEKLEREARGLGVEHSLDRMASLDWCRRNNDRVDAAIRQSHWAGDLPVLNEGKVKIQRTQAEIAEGDNVNDGWDTDPRLEVVNFIQPRSTAHRDGPTRQLVDGSFVGGGRDVQLDYSEGTVMVVDSDAPSSPPWTGPDATGAPGVTLMAPPRPIASTTPPTISVGASGRFVADWQRAIGMPDADGIFGPKTAARTKAWQLAHGIQADGIVGPRSWATLAAAPSAPTKAELRSGELREAPTMLLARYWRVVPEPRQPDVVFIHSAECQEVPTGAEAVAHYFQIIDRPASAHFAVDNDSAVQCVPMNDVAFAAGTHANQIGIHLELAGYARQTVADWHDAYSTAELSRAAELTAAICRRFEIPPVALDAAALRGGGRGISTHRCASEAWRESDHQDPGTAFPMAEFIAMVTSVIPAEPTIALMAQETGLVKGDQADAVEDEGALCDDIDSSNIEREPTSR
jgi:peptidoglycan hydrolase-like protein with peptidoglycan-binding domain/N-acetyl-anhydromuramyl-L-alanine amidase AmpD